MPTVAKIKINVKGLPGKILSLLDHPPKFPKITQWPSFLKERPA
jgi:hypothetical protein